MFLCFDAFSFVNFEWWDMKLSSIIIIRPYGFIVLICFMNSVMYSFLEFYLKSMVLWLFIAKNPNVFVLKRVVFFVIWFGN